MERNPVAVGGAALLLGGAMLLVAGCGFKPLYGDRGVRGASVKADTAQVAIAPIADRSGQILRNELIDRLTPQGQPSEPAYSLTVVYQENKVPLGIRVDETATRANMNLTARFTLHDRRQGVTVYSGASQAQVSYNIVDADFATIVAERDARQRGIILLADGIALRLGLYFNRLKTLKRTAAKP